MTHKTCQECASTDYYAKGYCTGCYHRAYQRANKERIRAYQREYRLKHDQPKPLKVKPLCPTCLDQGKDVESTTAGFCRNHYMLNYYYERSKRRQPVVSDTPAQTYETHHTRITFARGRAKEYKCVECHGQARDWSLKHTATNKRLVRQRGDSQAYISDDFNDYEPRCGDCHKDYDARTRNRTYSAGGVWSKYANA